MEQTWTITRRQFASFFNGPVAYIVAAIVLIAAGVWFWWFKLFFTIGRVSLRDLFSVFSIIFAVAIPALTMGLIAEEKRSGTIELLLTMPVRDRDVVMGKFLGTMGLILVILGLTVTYPISLWMLARQHIDWGPIIGGYVGLTLEAAAYVGIGLLASAYTTDQIVAFFAATFVCVVFAILYVALPLFPSGFASILEWISFDYHFESMGRGVLDTRDIAFFLSIVTICTAITLRKLDSRRWT